MSKELWEALERQLPAAIELRHELHRDPELSGEESITRDRVLAALGPSSEPHKVAETGAVVRIGGAGPAIGLRGELDALPITENSGYEWASQNTGVMHACGHDVHLAALVAVGRAIDAVGGDFPLLAVLQPREETYPSGAQDIASHGVLVDEECQAMIGVHIQPTLDEGTVACVPGAVNGSSDEFTIVIEGEPGHAAYPHLTRDPLLAAAHLVVALQAVVSRVIDPMASAVLGVSSFSAGEAANVVPGVARVSGTLRSLDDHTRLLLQTKLTETADHIARSHGCTAETRITVGEPVLRNNPELAEATSAQLRSRGVEVSRGLRSLGADDFAFFAEYLPSLMLFVGTTSAERLHSPTFLPPDDSVRAVAEAMLSGYLGACEALKPPTSRSKESQ
ncbi:amidohydrolase [Aeromicrobium phragmitis]|uniref:Amidohydrolase n=1 Tax=Aeromicrobium phragmitis TaxID=2478914 RepID=A0A3L8PRU7_9ACTN|nr:M20 family metallopeptidase [Aeromicrobium phragmitis]RLV57108.1 amidohydrolase [Aeromicrobium phragmitis]